MGRGSSSGGAVSKNSEKIGTREAAKKLEEIQTAKGTSSTDKSFLSFYQRGGVGIAVKRDGWMTIRKTAARQGVTNTTLSLMDIIFEGK